MANIHSAPLTFTRSLVTAVGYRSLPAGHPVPAHIALHSVPRGPLRQGGLTPCFALTTSCASPKPLPSFAFKTRWPVLAAWTIRCWSWVPSRRYLSRTFPWMLGPLPRLSQWCIYPFLPTERRPSRNGYAVGSLATPRTTTSVRTVLSWAAVIPLCSGLQVCLPPGSSLPPSLLLPSTVPVVAFRHVEYASRLNRAIDGRGLTPH